MGEAIMIVRALAGLWLAHTYLSLVVCRPDDGDLDSQIASVFGTPPSGNFPPEEKHGGNVDGRSCECVPYYLCENGSIIDDGKGIIDIR